MYVVERVIASRTETELPRRSSDGLEYRVKWKGYTDVHNSWQVQVQVQVQMLFMYYTNVHNGWQVHLTWCIPYVLYGLHMLT